MIIGYLGGVFDLFHIGHLNIIRNAKGMCDVLIVGVTSDELVTYKHKKAVIPYKERAELVRNIRFVDVVVPQEIIDKYDIWKRLKFNILFVGDDWYGQRSWKEYERKLKKVGVKVVHFPYTKGTSSTLINEVLLKLRK